MSEHPAPCPIDPNTRGCGFDITVRITSCPICECEVRSIIDRDLPARLDCHPEVEAIVTAHTWHNRRLQEVVQRKAYGV